ncbi:ribonuclease H-like protein [Mollisia scopiformis]|uniref:Ribonuclease H-like protein n=1 Tax=Mollisia scopiformis TaxID=149040 RepID=A0A194XL11_MOLSC|nr:ribonuclease H-like protein [Mollisia scopiformis]KUJ20784.1 ribonuclease H-like protein [Mollisia scopiformis]
MSFTCPICPQKFATWAALTVHISDNGEHVPCPQLDCIAVFHDEVNMEKHFNKMHKQPSSVSHSTTLQPPPKGRPSWIPLEAFAPQDVPIQSMPPGLGQTSADLRWSVIPAAQYLEAITKLRQRVHSHELLEKRGYFRSSQDNRFQSAPLAAPSILKYYAVALDCEMVGAHDGEKEQSVLARLSVVDYLTGFTIIDSLVQPDMRVTDWRTRYSGVTPAAMHTAVRAGKAIRGHSGAREALWRFIDSETVIVGQSLRNDFEALKIIHSRIVDSGIVTAEAINVPSQTQVGLKVSCAELLGISIQQDRRRGHDSVEDSLAAREVVLFCLNQTEKLETWAKVKREEHAKAAARREVLAAKQRAERREALDKKIAWSRDPWPEEPTREEAAVRTVRLPLAESLLRMIMRVSKQNEMISPLQATWGTTISRTRQEWSEAPSENGYDRLFPIVKLPLSKYADALVHDKRDEKLDQGWSFSNSQAEEQLDVHAETSQTILDQPLDCSEDAFLMEPLIPFSPRRDGC